MPTETKQGMGEHVPQTWPERMARLCLGRLHFFFWPFVGAAVFVGQVRLIEIRSGCWAGMAVFATYLGLLGYLGVLSAHFRRRLSSLLPVVEAFVDEPPEPLREWYRTRIRALCGSAWDFVLFLFILVFGTATLICLTDFFRRTTPWFGNPYSDYYALGAFGLFCLLVSHHLRLAFSIVFLAKSIAQKPVRVRLCPDPDRSVTALGRLLFTVSFNYAVGAGILYLGIYVSPLPITPLAVFWMCVIGCVLLFIFLYPQAYLHLAMKRSKQKLLSPLSAWLDEAILSVLTDPSSSNTERFGRLCEVRDRLVDGIPEWPFQIRSLAAFASAVLLPITLSIIDILVR